MVYKGQSAAGWQPTPEPPTSTGSDTSLNFGGCRFSRGSRWQELQACYPGYGGQSRPGCWPRYSTWDGGWCTGRRSQRLGSCCHLGCTLGEDSVRHCAECSRLHAFANRRLLLGEERLPQQQALAFLMLQPRHLLTDETLIRRSLLVAAAYRVYCSSRRGRPLSSQEGLWRALEQGLKEAARGHPGATNMLDMRWVRTDARCEGPEQS